MDQAYAAVQSKAAPIMRAPYRLCAYAHDLLPRGDRDACCSSYSASGAEFAIPMAMVEVATGKTLELSRHTNIKAKVMGRFIKRIELDNQLPTAGKTYRIYDTKSQGFSRPIRVVSVTKQELGSYEVKYTRYERHRPSTLVVNPDYAVCDPEMGIYGASCRWVAVKTVEQGEGEHKYHTEDTSLALGSPTVLNHLLYGHGYARGADKQAGADFVLRLDTRFKNNAAYTFHKLATLTALMVEADADEVMAWLIL